MAESRPRKYAIGRLIDNGISYVPDRFMVDSFKHQSGRFWLYRKHLSTITFRGVCGEAAREKNFDRFKASEEEVGRFIEEFLSTDPENAPSNFSDGFHRFFGGYGRASGTSNAFLGRRITGGWQSAIERGHVKGHLRKYDLNSAYAWSASLGLPDPKTFCLSRDVARPGIYVLRGVVNCDRPPFPLTPGIERWMILSDEEVKRYNVDVREVWWGQSWRNVLDTRSAIDAVRDKFTDWKRVLRSFWGGWAARTGPTSGTFDDGKIVKRWQLPNHSRNYIWAHLIMSRVKSRVYDVIKDACYVFVDSVITRKTLTTGTNIGDWKLEKEYPEGVVIFQAGVYRDMLSKKLEKHSGRVSDSAYKENTVYGTEGDRISREENQASEREAICGESERNSANEPASESANKPTSICRKLPRIWRQSSIFDEDCGPRKETQGNVGPT